ncbi:MAG: shikimate kinase [Fimbriimonadaceae bacterium]
MERCWILLGMMGSGKSALGRSIAEASGREFIDTDILVQNSVCRPVGQVFKLYGEAAFREHEAAVLRKLMPGHSVISTGGGIVLRPDNWIELRRLGITVYLDAPIEALIERLERSKKRRPLLQGADWQSTLRQLLEERVALYRRADLTVAVGDKDVDATARDVMGALQASA